MTGHSLRTLEKYEWVSSCFNASAKRFRLQHTSSICKEVDIDIHLPPTLHGETSFMPAHILVGEEFVQAYNPTLKHGKSKLLPKKTMEIII